jgi:hypothetical protein
MLGCLGFRSHRFREEWKFRHRTRGRIRGKAGVEKTHLAGREILIALVYESAGASQWLNSTCLAPAMKLNSF